MKRSNRFPVSAASAFSLLVVTTALILLSACASTGPPTADTLPLGPAELRTRELTIRDGEIHSAYDGERIGFEELIERLASVRIVYLGESHTSMATHRMQLRIIEGLQAINPNLLIGMEFFQRSHAAELADWSAGHLDEEELLRATGWYAGGGYNFGYYRPILEFARDHGLPVVGLNIPRSIVHKVAMAGLDSLSPEEREITGEVDVTNHEHRRLIEFYFGGPAAHGPPSDDPDEAAARFERMYAAQSTWDEAMAASVRRAMEGFDGIAVVIAGSGHCAYNLGINRRVAERLALPYATLLAVDVEPGESATAVRSLADYLYGITGDTDPPYYPSLGASLRDQDGRVVVSMVMPDSLAQRVGLESGDVVTSLDGRPVADVTDLRIRLALKSWGDSAELLVQRGESELTVTVTFER